MFICGWRVEKTATHYNIYRGVSCIHNWPLENMTVKRLTRYVSQLLHYVKFVDREWALKVAMLKLLSFHEVEKLFSLYLDAQGIIRIDLIEHNNHVHKIMVPANGGCCYVNEVSHMAFEDARKILQIKVK